MRMQFEQFPTALEDDVQRLAHVFSGNPQAVRNIVSRAARDISEERKRLPISQAAKHFVKAAVSARKYNTVVLLRNFRNLSGEIPFRFRRIDIDRSVSLFQLFDDIRQLFRRFSLSAIGIVNENTLHKFIISYHFSQCKFFEIIFIQMENSSAKVK